MKSGEIVKYSFNEFIYYLELISLTDDDEYCQAKFLYSVGIKNTWYKKFDIGRYPKKYITPLTKLEQALK